MSVLLVQSGYVADGATGVTLASPVTVGNKIVCIQLSTTGTITLPSDNKSNTYTERIKDSDVSGNFAEIATATATTGGSSFIVTGTTGVVLWVGEFSGVDAAVLDGSAVSAKHAADSAAFTITTPGITTTVGGAVLVAGYIDQGTATVTVNDGATTAFNTADHDRDVGAYRRVGAPGSYAQSFTTTAVSGNTAVVVAIALKNVPLSDNFNRANESPIASPWVMGVVAGSSAGLSISSNTLLNGTPGSDRLSYRTDSAEMFSQVKITTVSDSDGGPAICCGPAGATNAYTVTAFSGTTIDIWKITAGTFGSSALATVAATYSVGDVISIRRSGANVIVAKNGSDILTFADSSFTSGFDGAVIFNGLVVDDWQNFATTPVLFGSLGQFDREMRVQGWF